MILPSTWTAIAVREWDRWTPVDGAICSLKEAKSLYEDGLALMSQRRVGPNVMEIVIKASKHAKG
jgi:hypothetical protein